MTVNALSKKKALERIFVFQAVEYGYLTQDQLKECIDEHERCEPPVPLLTICKQKGYLTASQVNHLMSKRLDASVAKAFGEGLSMREEGRKEPVTGAPKEESSDKQTMVLALPREEKEEYDRLLAEKDRLLEREQKQREFLKRKADELEEKLSHFEQEKQDLLEQKQQEISTLESELLCYKGLNEQREQELNKALAQIGEKDSLIKREQQKAQGLFNLLEQGGKELRESEEMRLKAEAELEKKQKEIEFLNAKMEKENKDKNQYKKEVEDSQEKIHKLNKEVEDLKNKISTIEKAPPEARVDLTVLKDKEREIEEKSKEQHTQLLAKLEEKDRIHADISSRMESLKKEHDSSLEQLRQEKRQLLEQVEEARSRMEEEVHRTRISLESEISQYKQKAENLESKLQQYQNSLGNWDDQEKKFKKQLEQEEQKRRDIEIAKSRVEKKAKDLEEKLSRFQLGEISGELETGTILPGSNGEYYVIQKTLGKGGMGIAYSALRGSDDMLVVVKTLFPEAMDDMKVVMRFVQEARTIMSFEHENLVKGYDLQQGKSGSYFVMEFLDGESVEEMLEEQGFIDVAESTRAVLGIARALQYLEEHHLVHRDVKPANILLNSDGVAKLVDFGIVKMTDRTCTLTTEGIILGTPYYLSPEQTYQTNVDIRSDIYCLGATYYHMVIGEVPFPGDNPIDVIQKRLVTSPKPGKVKPDLPRPICNLIEKMMNKNAKKRHNNAKELVQELEMIVSKL